MTSEVASSFAATELNIPPASSTRSSTRVPSVLGKGSPVERADIHDLEPLDIFGDLEKEAEEVGADWNGRKHVRRQGRSRLEDLRARVDEVKAIKVDNIVKVSQRGERFEDVGEISEKLEELEALSRSVETHKHSLCRSSSSEIHFAEEREPKKGLLDEANHAPGLFDNY